MGHSMSDPSPEVAAGESYDSLAQKNQKLADVDPENNLASHLNEPLEDVEDTYGPVPPTAEQPYVSMDPTVKDWSPLPSGPVRR